MFVINCLLSPGLVPRNLAVRPRYKMSISILTYKYIKLSHQTVKTLMAVLVSIGLMTACSQAPDKSFLDDILASREITVITRNNPWCYYLYRDRPMGFEYDLAKAFADYLGVRLNVKVADRWDRMIPDLLNGKGDFIAASMTITPTRQDRVAFSNGYHSIQPHIIVHRHQSQIKGAEDLAGKTVHVSRGTSYHEHLEVLRAADIDVNLQLHNGMETTELIRKVANKSIDITIADNLVAMLSQRYYPQITLAGPISAEEHLGWAVHPQATQLQGQMNAFYNTIKKNGEFDRIFNHYFTGIDEFDFVDIRAFHRGVNQALPEYQPFLQKFAEQNGFDWRLIAAQMYQESRFDPMAVSYQSAHGLMQISINTADSLGVVDVHDPCQNIEAGIRHLKFLFDFYDKAQGKNRLYIALAAYNVGMGHILDARNLARKQGLDPDKWASLKKTLPLLSEPEYYQKTKYGYCRGLEPVHYINNIIVFFDILKFKGMARK